MNTMHLSRAVCGVMMVMFAACVGEEPAISDDDDDPNATDGELADVEQGLPESVADDAVVATSEPLAIGSFARVCNTDGLGLRQRSAPGIDQTILRGLPEGAVVEIVGEADGWRETSWDGLVGWSSSAYLCTQVIEDESATGTVVINGWTRPLSDYVKTQRFKGASVHNGVDLAKAYGSTVYAAHTGTVTEIIKGYCRAGYACKGTGKNWALDPRYHMSGDKVVVRHSDGMKTVYDHCGASGLSWIGKKVYPDTPICQINRTGNRTGAHLHFAVISKAGTTVDPEKYVTWL
jgi:murein DD-endopeptidase MepM/ murein hydrolase activator NlpD